MGDGLTLPQQQGPFVRGAAPINGPSQYNGVQKAQHGKWRVKICRQGVISELGTYDNEIEAAQAYQAAAAEYDKLRLRSN